jgi:hypothetical protein
VGYAMISYAFKYSETTNGASDNTETFQSDAILDDVVISGVSCRLPESDNIEEFRQHLINKDDMVTDDERRWPQGTEFGESSGILAGIFLYLCFLINIIK